MLLPQSILLGATFPLVSSAVLRTDSSQPGHDVAALYFLNSLGAFPVDRGNGDEHLARGGFG